MTDILQNYELPRNVEDAGARQAVANMGITLQDDGQGVQTMSGFEKDGIPYQFCHVEQYNHAKSLEVGYEMYDLVEACTFYINRKTIHVEQLKYLSPDRLRRNIRGEIVGGRFFDNYKRWKQGLDAPGLPIDKWDILDRAQVATLKSENIFSVEQFAAMPRTRVEEIFGSQSPFVDLYERAGLRQNNKDIAVKSKAAIDRLLAELEEQRKRSDDQAEELAALRKQVGGGKVNKLRGKSKSKRKRPSRAKSANKLKGNNGREEASQSEEV